MGKTKSESIRLSVRINKNKVSSLLIKKEFVMFWLLYSDTVAKKTNLTNVRIQKKVKKMGPDRFFEKYIKTLLLECISDYMEDWEREDSVGLSDFILRKMFLEVMDEQSCILYKRLMGIK